jgi:hypothetical protein
MEKQRLWTSNGNWTGMQDVIDAISEGWGFVYFAGHGNPMSWGDHLPGIPGGRDDGMINGLKNVNLDFGLARYESEAGDAFFPMDHLTNGDKQPITLIGGCHNSMIDSSFSRLLVDPNEVLFTYWHGAWVPECFSWWLARMPQGGGIATIGCSGLGYGIYGSACLEAYGGWINPMFFKMYNNVGYDILGETFTHTLNYYAESFGIDYDIHRKTFEEWVLLGDPSLKMGGYPPSTDELASPLGLPQINDVELVGGTTMHANITNTGGSNLTYFDWEFRIDGSAPLARYFGLSGTILEGLFRGRVLGGVASGDVPCLKPGETLEITSNPAFGIGHIEVNITIAWKDIYGNERETWYKVVDLSGNLVEVDGFLLGNRLFIDFPEE